MGDGEPAVEEGRVDAPEVDGVARVAVVQVSQVGVGAVQAGFYRTAQQEDGGRGAVVGAGAAVFIQAAAELGEDEHQHAVGFARFLQVVQEGRERLRRGGAGAGRAAEAELLWVSKPSRCV